MRILPYISHFDRIWQAEDQDGVILVQETDGYSMRTAIRANGDEKPVFFAFKTLQNLRLKRVCAVEHLRSPKRLGKTPGIDRYNGGQHAAPLLHYHTYDADSQLMTSHALA